MDSNNQLKNSDRFLMAFSKIERYLRRLTNSEANVPFSSLISTYGVQNPVGRNYANDLREFGDLRNAIVHERTDGHVIAEPNDRAVDRFEMLAYLIADPPKVIPKFQTPVVTLTSRDSIAVAVSKMYTGGFSQIPIYDDCGFAGLLTGTTVARWLGAKVSDDVFGLEGTPIADVLKHGEYPNNYQFISRDGILPEVVEYFHKHEELEEVLEALLITESGDRNQSLLGIITSWDLSEVHKCIAV